MPKKSNNPKEREASAGRPTQAEQIRELQAGLSSALNAGNDLKSKSEALQNHYSEMSDNVRALKKDVETLQNQMEALKEIQDIAIAHFEKLLKEKFSELDKLTPTALVKPPAGGKVQMLVLTGQNVFALDAPMTEKEAVEKAKKYPERVIILPVY